MPSMNSGGRNGTNEDEGSAEVVTSPPTEHQYAANASNSSASRNGRKPRVDNRSLVSQQSFSTTPAAVAADGSDNATDDATTAYNNKTTKKRERIKLYKGSRFKGYLTLTLASAIHYNAARKCDRTIGGGAVACTPGQRRYSQAVSLLSLIVSTLITYGHLDPVPYMQRNVWNKLFGKPRGKVELFLVVFLVLWWSVAVGMETTVQGIAGDGKQQYSLYYSAWACCLVSYYWILENYLMDAGWSSFQGFIASWPYRAPAWICITIFSCFTFIWYMDLWKNHTLAPDGPEMNQTITSQSTFQDVPKSQWEWLITVAIFTFFPALAFCLVELFRDVTADGKSVKPKAETLIEGIVFAALCVAWIPTVIVATTPGGAASLIGNAYFFTWLLVVFLFEGLMWWIHDYRLQIHHELKKKALEYKMRQREILEKTVTMQRERIAEMRGTEGVDDDDNDRFSSKDGNTSDVDDECSNVVRQH